MKASIAFQNHQHTLPLHQFLRRSRTCSLKLLSKYASSRLVSAEFWAADFEDELTAIVPNHCRPVLAVSDARRTDGSQKGPVAPSSFYCPISMELMNDPVMVATGHTYDRVCIERWLQQGNRTCPVTGMRLRHLELTPNFALRNAIQVRTCRHSASCTNLPAAPPCPGFCMSQYVASSALQTFASELLQCCSFTLVKTPAQLICILGLAA